MAELSRPGAGKVSHPCREPRTGNHVQALTYHGSAGPRVGRSFSAAAVTSVDVAAQAASWYSAPTGPCRLQPPVPDWCICLCEDRILDQIAV